MRAIVGAMTTWKGKAAFDRAPLVLALDGDRCLIARRWADGKAEGDELTADEWEALTQSGDAMRIGGLGDAEPDSFLWLFRPHFPRARHAVLSEILAVLGLRAGVFNDHALACHVVELPSVVGLRAEWAARLDGYARARLVEAEGLAEAAVQVAVGMSDAHVEVLVSILRRLGETARADQIVETFRSGLRVQGAT